MWILTQELGIRRHQNVRQMIEITNEIFVVKAQNAFSFLIEDYGFSCEVKPWCLRLETEKTLIDIFNDCRSWEVGFQFRNKEKGDNLIYDLSHILVVEGGNVAKNLNYFFQSKNSVVVNKRLEEVSSLIQRHCHMVLVGDELTLERIKKTGLKKAKAWQGHYASAAIKREADLAWQKKDYKKVVQLYKRILEYLNVKEKRRYSYAKKKLL